MKRIIVTDAEFEVVKGPDQPLVAWQPGRREGDPLSILRWFYVGVLAFAAAMTLLAGLAGADLDTRDDVRQPPSSYALTPGVQADGTIAVAPVD